MGQRSSAKIAAGVAAGITVCAGLLLPWWRNHAMLRDFYDYGNIIAGVGRMQLGERPYVDFLAPIQTLQFWVGVLAERWWGAEYLSLTYTAAVFTVGMFALLAWLLMRPLGGGLALLVAAAVVAASAAQHTIIWYNAMGVAWLAIGVWVSAQAWRNGRSQGVACGLIVAALWLGGMTKLTYQVGAAAFVGLFVLRSAGREMSKTKGALLIAVTVVAATVLPVATEMILTGASFSQWKKNVLELASSRVSLLRPLATWRFYWHTPHDYYRSLYLPFVGGWGVGLAAAVGWAAAWRLRREKADRREWGFLAAAWGGVVACGVVFQAVHIEIAYLAGAAWLVLATGLVLAFVPRGVDGPHRLARVALGVAAITLVVPAWVSAWSGVRALWGHRPLVRSELVSTDDLPERFSYLRGIRILPEWHESLRALDRVQRQLEEEGVEESAWYFVNGSDWLVRAMPEARHPGLPLWLQYGTTYGDVEAASIARRFEQGSEIKVIVSHHPWSSWVGRVQRVLNERHRVIDVGPAFVTRRVLSELDWPLQFAERFNTNLYARDLEASGGVLAMRGRPEAPFFGARESARLTLQRGIYRLSGDWMTELASEDIEGPVTARFRVRRLDDEGAGTLLWDEEVELTRESRAITRPFAVSPGGHGVALEVELPPGGNVLSGWRNLQTLHAGEMKKEEVPRAVRAGLKSATLGEAEWAALAKDPSQRASDAVLFGDAKAAAKAGNDALAMKGPGELWLRFDEPKSRVSGSFRVGLSGGSRENGGVRVLVAYYKSGRFDVMHRQDVRFGENDEAARVHSFDVPPREGIGWVVLVAMPLDERWSGTWEVYWDDLSFR